MDDATKREVPAAVRTEGTGAGQEAGTGINRVMEMWKTAAYADGKPIHGLWKRTGLSHRTANRFPTATPVQAVYAHSHNACCG